MNKDTSRDEAVDIDDESTDESDATGDDRSLTRRRLVAAGAATWASVSVAGCQYITDPGTDTPTETDTPTVTTETTTTDDPSTPGSTGSEENESETSAETPTETETPSPTPTPTEAPTTTACENVARFAPGMEVGLHVGIFDPESGEPLGADAIESVTVEFPDADYGPLELNWEGAHEAYDAATWGSKIVTDLDTEPGTYEYEVNVDGGEETDIAATIADRFTIV